MSEVDKMNEAMYERLGEIVFKAVNARTICNGASGADEKNLQLLAAFTDLRQMCEFYKPSEKEPVVPGCPSLMPRQLPGGFDGVGPAEKDVHGLHGLHGLNSDPNPCKSVKSEDNAEKLEKSYLSMRGRLEKITDLALAADAKCGTCDKVGQNWMTCSKAMCAIRKLVRESIADAAPDYEMLALQFARNSFDFAKFQEALAAVASMKAEDFPGVYYKPGWLVELAKKLEAGDVHGLHGLHGLNADPNPCESVKSVDEAESQAELQREEARQLRKIHWRCYETKVDLCVMGKTRQDGKVYEVRIAKRSDSKVQDTYGQCKVNGKGVLTCSSTCGAWMLKRILTAGMQAIVNYKAKRNRDSRRNYAKRDAAKAAQKEVH